MAPRSANCRDRGRSLVRRTDIPTLASATCERCGNSFDYPRHGGKPRRYCSSDCGYQHRRHNTGTLTPCKACGKGFLANKDRKQYCSGSCRTSFLKHGRPPALECPVEYRTCALCNRPWVRRGQDSSYCPGLCREIGSSYAYKWEKELQSRPLIGCKECGTEFRMEQGRKFCGSKCARRYYERTHPEWTRNQRRIEQHRRRARLANARVVERVDPLVVFKRDGYRCALCGIQADSVFKAPHPLSPSLDHIVPIAQGGDHSYANSQCAHFYCNSLKSAGDPLREDLMAERLLAKCNEPGSWHSVVGPWWRGGPEAPRMFRDAFPNGL